MGTSNITIGMGAAFGGWDDVPPGAAGVNRAGEYTALTPVGAREFLIDTSFQVDGTTGDDVQLWLMQLSFAVAGQLNVRVRYYTADGRFNLYAGFNGDSDNIDITPTDVHTLQIRVFDDGGVMKAEFTLDAVVVFTIGISSPLEEIAEVRLTFPQLIAPTPTGAGLTFATTGFALETTT